MSIQDDIKMLEIEGAQALEKFLLGALADAVALVPVALQPFVAGVEKEMEAPLKAYLDAQIAKIGG